MTYQPDVLDPADPGFREIQQEIEAIREELHTRSIIRQSQRLRLRLNAGMPPQTELTNLDTEELCARLFSNLLRVYGEDHRTECYLAGEGMEASCRASVALFRESELLRNPREGYYYIRAPTAGDVWNLCPKERFRRQPSAARCSGVLVGPRTVLTGYHCVGLKYYVFGFEARPDGAVNTTFDPSQVYTGCPFVGDNRADWALVTLDREVKDVEPVTCRASGKIEDKANIYYVGYPLGLPKKHGGGAWVRDNTPRNHFVANLDAFIYSSGSPVFCQETHRLEGIIRGEDRDPRIPCSSGGKRCYVFDPCLDHECRGVTVVRVTALTRLLDTSSFP